MTQILPLPSGQTVSCSSLGGHNLTGNTVRAFAETLGLCTCNQRSISIQYDLKHLGALHVDGNRMVRVFTNIMGLRIHLQKKARVSTVTTVGAARELLEKQTFDLILSDINLGDREPTGYELLAHVRQTHARTRFWMVSGCTQDDEEPKAKKLGADGYLQLPFELKDVFDIVDQA